MSVSLFPKGKVNAEALLEIAKSQGLKELVIVGIADEDQVWLASSLGENAYTHWLLSLASAALIDEART